MLKAFAFFAVEAKFPDSFVRLDLHVMPVTFETTVMGFAQENNVSKPYIL